jgi:hypothetical protein
VNGHEIVWSCAEEGVQDSWRHGFDQRPVGQLRRLRSWQAVGTPKTVTNANHGRAGLPEGDDAGSPAEKGLFQGYLSNTGVAGDSMHDRADLSYAAG